MPYADEVGLAAWTFQPDSWLQMASRQPNSEEDMPNCGIRALASVRGSAEDRSSVRVRAGPLALERLRTLLRSATGTGRRERETGAGVTLGRSAARQPVPRLASAEATPGGGGGRELEQQAAAHDEGGGAPPSGQVSSAASRRRRRKRPASGRASVRGVVLCGQDGGHPSVDDMDVSRVPGKWRRGAGA